MQQNIYPRSKDRETVYLNRVISNPAIVVGDYTMYNDFIRDPRDFQKNNVLYQYLPTHFPSFLKNGAWIRETSGKHGTTKGIL